MWDTALFVLFWVHRMALFSQSFDSHSMLPVMSCRIVHQQRRTSGEF